MATFNSFVLFVLIWWVALFAVLPWGVRPQDHADTPGRWSGTPERPLMWRKVLATTAVSIVLWTAAQFVLRENWINLRPPGTESGYSGASASVTGE